METNIWEEVINISTYAAGLQIRIQCFWKREYMKQYVYASMQLDKVLINECRCKEAIEYLTNALSYSHNLEGKKLQGICDNDQPPKSIFY